MILHVSEALRRELLWRVSKMCFAKLYHLSAIYIAWVHKKAHNMFSVFIIEKKWRIRQSPPVLFGDCYLNVC